VYAFGLEQDGLQWMAMEFVRGTALDVVLERRRALGLMETIASCSSSWRWSRRARGRHHPPRSQAREHHGRGPSGQRVPQDLLDLGVALDISGAAAAPNAKGPTGTPLYMAPELWVDPDSAGPQTDIYAMAAITYELLTGTPAFRGAGIREISAAHAFQVPPSLPAPLPEALSTSSRTAWPSARPIATPTALAFGAALRDATSVKLVEKGALHIDQQVADAEGELAYAIGGTLSEDFPAPAIPATATRVRVNLAACSASTRAASGHGSTGSAARRPRSSGCSKSARSGRAAGHHHREFLPGQVTSYFAPYFCDACGDENLVLVRAPSLPPERRACAACDEQATLD
jgi:hypothetical protein